MPRFKPPTEPDGPADAPTEFNDILGDIARLQRVVSTVAAGLASLSERVEAAALGASRPGQAPGPPLGAKRPAGKLRGRILRRGFAGRVVRKILGDREQLGATEYLVAWVGYSENTWVPGPALPDSLVAAAPRSNIHPDCTTAASP